MARLRAACVTRFNKFRDKCPDGEIRRRLPGLIEALNELYPQFGGLSAKTLYTWAQKYNESEGIQNLIDWRGGNRRGKGDAVAWTYFCTLYHSMRAPDLRDLWDRTDAKAQAEGWKWCSWTSCRRQHFTRLADYRESVAPVFVDDPAYLDGARREISQLARQIAPDDVDCLLLLARSMADKPVRAGARRAPLDDPQSS